MLVLPVDRSRWNPVEARAILLPQRCVLFLFILENFLAGSNKLSVKAIELDRSLNRLRKVLGGSLLLELLKLSPDFLRNLAGSGDTAKDPWEAESLKPSIQLLVEVLILRHFAVDDLVQDRLKLLLHLADCGRHQMA